MIKPFCFGVTLGRAPSRAAWVAKARHVEALGYAMLTVPDHLADFFAPLLALVSTAEATMHLRVGTNVLNNDFRHPVLVAREVATIDLLTEGRFQLGLGAGYMHSEYDEAGFRFEVGGRRVARLVFTRPPVGDRQATARTVDVGHGRIEQRNITTSEAPVGYSDWPGLAQVFELGRYVMFQKTGKERVEIVYGVTSLRPERATPERLLALVRGQWQIENQSHWVRDVTFDEDRSQVRCGNIPQVMAALRNTAIGLLRWTGHTNIDSAGELPQAPLGSPFGTQSSTLERQ